MSTFKKFKQIIIGDLSITNLQNVVDCLQAVEDSGLLPDNSELLESVSCNRQDIQDILTALKVPEKCPRCGHTLYMSDVEGYYCVCPKCDENFYGIEVKT